MSSEWVIAIGSEQPSGGAGQQQRSLILFETRRIRFVGRRIVYAQDPRGPAAVGIGAGAAPDRPQLLDRPKHLHKYLKLAQAAKLAWPLPEDLSEHQLDELMFGNRTAP